MIAGFEEPTSGEIRLNGASIQHLKPYQRNVSTVFQNYALFPHLTVRQNVEFGSRRTRQSDIASPRPRSPRTGAAHRKESRLPSQISGGEQQRVALARSLVLAPEVLLLDEPLSALDPNLRKQMRAELKSLQRRVGITFLFVTHDQEEALSMSDRIGVMHAGVLEQVGTPEEIYLRPAHALRGLIPRRDELVRRRRRAAGGRPRVAAAPPRPPTATVVHSSFPRQLRPYRSAARRRRNRASPKLRASNEPSARASASTSPGIPPTS